MKPILFNTPMTQATQENRKTETRRDPFQVPDGYEYQGLYWVEQPKGKRLCAVFHHADGTDINIPARYCPGDILWVRETWRPTGAISKPYAYRAAEDDLHLIGEAWQALTIKYRWRPSIHMPKEAARLFLKVTGVRVERLQDITPDDVEREGIDWVKNPLLRYDLSTMSSEGKCRFAPLWDSTIKPADLPLYGWEANPWVFVISFERIAKDEAVQ